VIIEVFTGAQIRALLEACEGEQNERMRDRAKTVIHVLTGTGLRAAERCHLSMSDIHLADYPPYIKVVAGKMDKSRLIPLGPVTLRKLSNWVTMYRTTAPALAPVFTNRAGREAMTPATLQQLFERLGERAHIDIARCSPHVCRHFFACECIKRKMSIYSLSKILGHSSVVMTERYVRALGADFDSLADMVQGQLR
jgi:integrase/recombinase XerD